MNFHNHDRSRLRPGDAVRRDADRMARRENSRRSFWRSLNVLGMVGWPIAAGAVGGAMLGRWIDLRQEWGVRCTLMFLTLGVLMGSWIAWKTVTQKND